MALTTIKTGALADDAVTEDKIANAINTARAANTAKDLTALSASNLTSGTLPDARFPATLPAASAANLTAVPAANITGTLPAISATNLTSIPAANITGTLPAISAANLTSIPAANITGTLPAISAANLTSIPAANITGTLPAISGANLTNLPASGTILQTVYGTSSTQYATTSQYPQDAFTFTITPTSATSTIVITMTIPIALNIATGIQLVGNYAICKNDNTVLTARQYSQQHDYMNRHSSGHAPTCQDTITLIAKDDPGSTSQQTYKVRYGQQSGYSHRVTMRDHEGPGGAGKDNMAWTIIEFE